MDPRQINLVVTQAGRCPLLALGDTFTVCSNEVSNSSGKVCIRALHALHTQLTNCLEDAPTHETVSYGPLYCTRTCGAEFRADILTEAESCKPGKAPEALHRNARRAAIAGAMLKNLGSFMERVPPEVSSLLMRASVVKAYANSEVILPEGVVNKRFFIVGDGEVCLTRRFPLSNEDSLLATLGVGDCFGEMALLTEEINQITVRAHPSATIYCIQGERIQELMTNSPAFLLAVSQMLADRLRVFLATIEDDVRPGMRGDVTTIPVVDLVQAMNAGRRSGTLVLDDGKTEGRIVFSQGKIVSAVIGERFGEDVFYELAAREKGKFSFEAGDSEVPEEQRIVKETLYLLMEHTRRADEAGRGRKTLIMRKSGEHKIAASDSGKPGTGVRKTGKYKRDKS